MKHLAAASDAWLAERKFNDALESAKLGGGEDSRERFRRLDEAYIALRTSLVQLRTAAERVELMRKVNA